MKPSKKTYLFHRSGRFFYALCLSLFFILSARAQAKCPNGGDRTQCKKDWTLLVFMEADNNLFPYALWDLYEMETGYSDGSIKNGSTPKLDLVVEVDANDQSGSKRFHMVQGQEAYNPNVDKDFFLNRSLKDVRSPVVGQIAEDLPLKTRVRNFVDWAIENYPSEHYMVVFWGHGRGFSSLADGIGGVLYDDAPASHLTTQELSDALGDHHFELITFDACFMQSLEVLHELAPKTRFLLGSTQVQNFLGLPYRAILREINTENFNGLLNGQPDQTSRDEPYLLAQMIPEIFQGAMRPRGVQGRRASSSELENFVYSSIATEEYSNAFQGQLFSAYQDLSNFLKENEKHRIRLKLLLTQMPSNELGQVDLGAFITILQNYFGELHDNDAEDNVVGDLTNRLSDLRSALIKMQVESAFGSSYTGQDSQRYLLGNRGLSIWVPQSKDIYQKRRTDFLGSRLYQDAQKNPTPLIQFLDLLFQ